MVLGGEDIGNVLNELLNQLSQWIKMPRQTTSPTPSPAALKAGYTSLPSPAYRNRWYFRYHRNPNPSLVSAGLLVLNTKSVSGYIAVLSLSALQSDEVNPTTGPKITK